MTKEELRTKIQATEVLNGKKRYGRELKQAIMDYVGSRIASGESLGAVAGDLGVKQWTVQRWQQNLRKAGGNVLSAPVGPVSFVQLEAATPSATERLELVLHRGTLRIPTDFDAGTLARVLTLLEGGLR